ncbi:YciI family protein [Amycolatopsis sp. OK19-0408]|uniref:YciI family protein n=1 Tax=Amycolatopsis iheyensis TaxID=2945988 RepID=A0A9X2NHQ8_9PSEU|nr:YciI family protein [Amycolatopsis iheyensis]MCR6489001.1 YciI family protein [Amycolatopsis iheyensis]
MAQFLLSVHGVDGEVREPPTEEEMRQSMSCLGEVEKDLKSARSWLFSARLSEPGAARVVRESAGELLVTDGPFAEGKEHLGGFYLVEAVDLDAALEWAGRVTAAIGVPIEVRPLAGFEA